MPELPDPVFVFRGLEKGVDFAEFINSKLEDFLLIGTSGGRLILIDWGTKKKTDSYTGQSAVLAGGLINDCIIWAQFRNDSIRFFDLSLNLLADLPQLPSNHCGFCKGRLSRNRKILAVPSSESGEDNICVYSYDSEKDLQNEKKLTEFYELSTIVKPSKASEKKLGMIMAIQLVDLAKFNSEGASPSNSDCRVLIAFENGSLSLYNATSGIEEWNTSLHSDAVMCFDYNALGNVGYSGSVDHQLTKWRLDEELRLVISENESMRFPSKGVNALSIRADGKIFLAACWDGTCRVYSVKTGKTLAAVDFHKLSLSCGTFSGHRINDHFLFAVGGQDESLSVWNLYGNK